MIDMENIDWNWINMNIEADPDRLRLSAHGDEKRLFEITQIDCRRRCRKKLADTLCRNPHFVFPSTLSAQQSTSDLLAEFHASLIENPGCKILDMTGGLGIDALHMSDMGSEITVCELNPITAECATHNFQTVKAGNVTVLNCDSVEFIRSIPDSSFDLIFIDPARRGSDGQRLFALSQCQPDVTAILGEMLRVAPRIIIKASPMLDFKHTLSELTDVHRIISVGNRNESKELIIECRRDAMSSPVLESVTLDNESKWQLSINPDNKESSAKADICTGNYIYDPFPAYAKICSISGSESAFGIHRIAPNTNLYISACIEAKFPGVAHEIIRLCEMNKRSLKEIAAAYPKINVTAKNFPMTSAELAKRLKTESGDEFRLFAFKDDTDRKLLAVCRRAD